MSIFNNIKKSLGFNVSEDNEYYSNDNKLVSASKGLNSSNEIYKNNDADLLIDQSAKDEQFKKMHLAIFDGVVSIFNSSLPEFLRSSINEEAQKEYIFKSLDESIRKYILNVKEEVHHSNELVWNKEKMMLLQEIKDIKSKNNEVEITNEELKKQQLSAERQKRALSARLRDLEAQVASFEAEREQYELENRSLINKLKASNVIDNDIETLRNDNIRLQQELSDVKQKTQIQLDNNQLNDLTSQISSLTDENESLKQVIEQLKVKEELSDAVINELNEKASNALLQLQCKDIEKRDNDDLLCKINSLEAQLESVNDELKTKIKELNDAQDELKVIDEIQTEITKFESIKIKNDEENARLLQEIDLYKARIKELEDDAESLKSTIENNLYNHAISEDLLKKEIKQLKEESKSQSKKKTRKKQDISPIKISAIDESIVDADWLISIPPEGTVTRPVSTTNPEDFGYQAPPRKNTPENEAQMSLW